MLKFDPIQHRSYLQDLLNRDISSNHTLLSHYLKLIISGRNLELRLPASDLRQLSDDFTVSISPKELWSEILTWEEKEGVNLVMGEHGSINTKASTLLSNLEKTQEASRTASSVREAINTSQPIKTTSTAAKTRELADFLELRRQTINLHNRRILGLSGLLERESKLIRKVSNTNTRVLLANLLAADAPNLKNENLDNVQIADEVFRLVQQNAGRNELNSVARLFYSDEAQTESSGGINEIKKIINEFIDNKKNYSETDEFTNSSTELRALTHTLTLNDIPTLVDLVASSLPTDKQQSLAKALQFTITSSLDSNYAPGTDLLSLAITRAGLDTTYQTQIAALSPYLEEIRAVELEPYLGNQIKGSDSRLLHTQNLAMDLGVSTKVIWFTQEDLDYQKLVLESKYGEGLEKILLDEKSDFVKISEIREYFSNRDQYTYYRQQVSSNTLFYLREKIGKARGNLAATFEPATRFYQKINKKVVAVDDFIHSPFRYISNKIEELQDKNAFWNILTPGTYIGRKLSEIQIGIALWMYKKTARVSRQAGLIGWFTRQINQYSKAFYKSYGNFSEANFHFIQSKWGNILNWSIKTASAGKYTTTKELRFAIANSIMSAFAKASPELAAKFAAGGLGKAIMAVIGGEMTMGASLAIQIAWEVGAYIFRKIKAFLTDPEFRRKFFNKLPIYAAISMGVGAIIALPTILLTGATALGGIILAFLAAAAGSVIGIFLLGGAWTLGLVAGGILLFSVFSTTTHLDSGPNEFVASVICNQGSSTTPTESASTSSVNPAASAAMCIVETLQGCNLSPLLGSMLDGSAWKCALAAITNPQVAVEIYNSAQRNTYFQCVGFIAATAAWIGKPIPQINACAYVNNAPSGYRYYSNTADMQIGDFFVIGSSNCVNESPGHVGVVCGVAGAVITACDANYGVAGGVRSDGQFARSQITGFMRPL